MSGNLSSDEICSLLTNEIRQMPSAESALIPIRQRALVPVNELAPCVMSESVAKKTPRKRTARKGGGV